MSDTPSTPSAPVDATQVAQEATGSNDAFQDAADVGNEIAEVISPQESKQPSEAEIKAAIKKWKLKSQGREREVTDEGELVRLAQLGLGAHEKFEQAANTRKKAEAVLELIQRDPGKALASLGLDVRKLAEDFIVQEANKKMMSPDERERHEIQQEIQRLKSEKDEMVKEQRDQQMSKLQSKYESDIQDEIIGAIDKYKLPKNPKTVARIAEYMASALENGYEATALDVATRVRQDLEEEHRSLFGHYDVEDLLKILGEDQLKKIRQYEVNKVKSKAPPNPTRTEQVPVPKSAHENEKSPKKKQSMDDFQQELFDKYLK